MPGHVFRYGADAVTHLKKRDKKLGLAIDRIGIIEREVIPDPFTALISSIVAQQISAKAALTVWNRMQERFGAITPFGLVQVSADEIQQCGISFKKAGYICGITAAVADGRLDFESFSTMSDDEIIQRLVLLPGVGIWTAEMLLIFSLQRPDVLSWNDLAIRRGMMNLYGLTSLTRDQFERYRRRYSPYGSVASLYLWAVAHGE